MIKYTVSTFLIDKRITACMQAADFGNHKVFGSPQNLIITLDSDTIDWSDCVAIGVTMIEQGEAAYWIIRSAQQENTITFNNEIPPFRHPDIWECSTGDKCQFIKCEIGSYVKLDKKGKAVTASSCP